MHFLHVHMHAFGDRPAETHAVMQWYTHTSRLHLMNVYIIPYINLTNMIVSNIIMKVSLYLYECTICS